MKKFFVWLGCVITSIVVVGILSGMIRFFLPQTEWWSGYMFAIHQTVSLGVFLVWYDWIMFNEHPENR